MLRRRQNNVSAVAVGMIGRNPREAVAIFAATAAIGVIFANALFWQSGPHPAPIFARIAPQQALPPLTSQQPMATPLPPPRADIAARPPAPIEVKHTPAKPAKMSEAVRNDPIAQLLAPSKRILAVQRVLAEYGYGQIKPTGTVGTDTQDAIRAFERAHRMPVTGAVSDQVVRALADMSGQSLD